MNNVAKMRIKKELQMIQSEPPPGIFNLFIFYKGIQVWMKDESIFELEAGIVT